MSAVLAVQQANRPLVATTPLGGDVLVPVKLTGTEELSRPYVLTVDFTSANAAVTPASLLGKPVGVEAQGAATGTRHFHGLVRRFANLGAEGISGRTRYRAELVPWLWMLSLSSDARTFENKTVLEIVEAVFSGAGYSDHKTRVTATPPALAYVAQYAETNLAFVSRMLEEAGLYYAFEFAADKHTLVISDAKGSAVPAGALASVPMAAVLNGARAAAAAQPDAVTRAEREYAVHAQTVALADFHLLRAGDSGSAPSTNPGANGELYAFLGALSGTPSAGVAAAEATRRIEAEESGGDVVRGASTCVSFTPGTRVTITGGAFGAAGVELQLVRVTHELEIGTYVGGGEEGHTLQNTFEAIPAATPFRPARTTRRPSVQGNQTALVVGTGGAGQIDVDKDGCVLLQFPWDRGAGTEGKSQHRVHVASLWSGTGWGAVQLPRIGQQILVEFLEGDPDRPIVTGRVYSNNHAHPYGLPDNKTQSGMKSRSVGGGADNFNELRFEDKQGSEHVYLQAEKDLQIKVKNDETRDVLHDRTTTIKNDDTLTVSEGKQVIEVSTGDQTTTVKQGKQTVEVSQGDQEVTVALGKQTVTVNGDQSLTVKQGNRSATVQMGNDELAVKMGNLTIDVSLGNISIKADVGSITLEALQGVTLKSGPTSSIQITPTGITAKGAMVSVEGMMQAALKAPMVSVQGEAMTTVQGAMTQVTGSGMLQLGGGVVMVG
ncbi:MAG TPA: type VI secretion system tip protein TssI/VgrG [Gemmatirosa sp.]